MEGVSVKYHSYIVDKAKRNLSWVHIDLEKKHWSLVFFQNAKEELKCYRKMDNLICVSEDVKQSVENLYPSLSDKCTVVYNLIDRGKIIRLAENQHVQKKKLTICMVGRLNQQKRYDRALEAARRLKQDGYDIDFWILGQGELFAKTNCQGIWLGRFFLVFGICEVTLFLYESRRYLSEYF